MATIGNIPNKIVNPESGSLTNEAKRWFYDLFSRIGGIGGTVAPPDATYVTNTPSADLSGEQALSLLNTGFVKVTTGSGLLSSTGNSLIQPSDLSTTAVTAGSYTVNGVASYTVDANGRLTSSSSPVITITGTTDKITVTGGTGATPTITIANTYIGQTSITTLGTITSGTWNGSSISTSYTDAKLKTLTGTTNRVTIAGTATDPTVDISTSYVGQNTITTLGTVTTGTWNGAKVSEVYGGTNQNTYTLGDILYSSASNVLSKLAGNITTTRKFLRQTGDGAASNAPTWDTIVAADVPGSALTSASDTNVTLTLGGSPSTALLNGTSITAGWSGQLGLTRGGTNSSLTASNGGVVYSDASSLQILSGTATAGKLLASQSSVAPIWTTPTYPTTSGTSGKVLISDGTNNVYSTPTFPNASATSGKFIRSDGTNWIASTPTLPTSAGSAGKILASDGTNYVESTPTFPYSASATAGKNVQSDGTNWVASSSTWPTTGTQGGVIYCDSANSFTQLAKNTSSTRYLSNTGTSNNPAWAQVDLSNGVTGNLPVGNLNSGTSASSSTFWRGDGTWAAPSGSGTVNSGTAGHLAYYATSGTAVSNFTTPSFQAYASGTTTAAASAFTKVAFATEEWDVGGYFASSTYTPGLAGIYQVNWKTEVTSNISSTGAYLAVLYKNGAAYKQGSFATPYSGTAAAESGGSALVSMNGSTDYIEVYQYNNNGATTNTVTADSQKTYFSAVWVGPSS